MPGDVWDDPDVRAWAQRVVDELLPMLEDSALTISVVPDQAGVDDIKFAVELGLSIMLDKPIILAVVPGRPVPAKLAKLADGIVEFDVDRDPAGTQRRIAAEVARILGDD